MVRTGKKSFPGRRHVREGKKVQSLFPNSPGSGKGGRAKGKGNRPTKVCKVLQREGRPGRVRQWVKAKGKKTNGVGTAGGPRTEYHWERGRIWDKSHRTDPGMQPNPVQTNHCGNRMKERCVCILLLAKCLNLEGWGFKVPPLPP